MYHVYILSCADTSLYCGITVDLEKRIHQHNNSPLGAKYTRARRPVTLVYSKQYASRSDASKEEARIKKLSRVQKIQLIQQSSAAK